MKATYLQGQDEMRGELQQVKDEHPTLANIADAAGSAVSPVNIFSKGNSLNLAKNIGKSMIGNFAGNGAGNTLFGRNLEHSLGRIMGNTVVGNAVNTASNNLEDFIRKK